MTSLSERPRWLRSEILFLALVVCLAVFFRLWRVGQIPPGMYFDEAFESLEAHRILTEPGYHPIFFAANNGVPPVNIYLTALAFLIAGEHTLTIRYVAALVGSLTILAVYLLARRLFVRSMDGDGAQRYVPLVAALDPGGPALAHCPQPSRCRSGAAAAVGHAGGAVPLAGTGDGQSVALCRFGFFLGHMRVHLPGGCLLAGRARALPALQSVPGAWFPGSLLAAARCVGRSSAPFAVAAGSIRLPEPRRAHAARRANHHPLTWPRRTITRLPPPWQATP